MDQEALHARSLPLSGDIEDAHPGHRLDCEIVRGDVASVKRILKPTVVPVATPSSSAMRAATDRAASRLGCV